MRVIMITDRLREMWADELEREYERSKRKKREKRIRTREQEVGEEEKWVIREEQKIEG